MNNMKPELWKVQEVAARNAQARRVFRQHQLGAGRARLTHAAAATSASVDEMLAVVAYRSRTVARSTCLLRPMSCPASRPN
ncbi:MAG: hypothetical protein HC876_08210 [Chloroflexaceae bacterium]|nr:hypothetical protein [Chloroflexaceae bacterium]